MRGDYKTISGPSHFVHYAFVRMVNRLCLAPHPRSPFHEAVLLFYKGSKKTHSRRIKICDFRKVYLFKNPCFLLQLKGVDFV